MAQIKNKVRGEYTYPSDFSEIPDGGLLVGLNVNVDRDSIAEPRRGFNSYKAISSTGSDRGKALLHYRDTLFANYASSLSKDGTNPFSAVSGTFATPDHGGAYRPKLKGVEANRNFYFFTKAGVKKMTSAASTPTDAGIPRGLDVNAALSGASGFMTNNTQVAYRILWGIKDANDNLILGAPSQRVVITNTSGGTRDVSLNFSIPAEITTANFYRIYRSGMSQDQNTEPNDELQLVVEDNPSSAEITAKEITVVDSTPEDLRGETIYTASSQEGIAQANDTPPAAKDICVFRNMGFLSNTIQKQQLSVTLLSVGGSAGLAVNDTITIAGLTYTAKASENIASREFALTTAGTPSQNIADTAQSLIKVINRNTSNTSVYAYYNSGFDELPGKIFIQARSLGASSFTVSAVGHTDAWSPNLGTTQTSTAEEKRHRLHVSKLQRYEAWPQAQYFDIGAADKEILRIVPLREVCIICKEDGFWRAVGDTPSTLQIEPIDLTTSVFAPETAKALANQLYCFTTQGFSTVNDSGVGVISRNIEDQIKPLYSFDNASSLMFSVAYETDRAYLCWVPESEDSTYPSIVHRFNVFTQQWTKWEKPALDALVNPTDDKLYTMDATSNLVFQERKNRDYSDYADEDTAVTISSVSGSSVTLNAVVSTIEAGDVLTQSGQPYTEIIAVSDNGVNTTLTLDIERPYSAGSATIVKAYECRVGFTAQFCGNPGIMKHIREIQPQFKNAEFRDALLKFRTDLKYSIEDVEISGFDSFLWGYFGWGLAPWGGYEGIAKNRALLPAEYQRCSWVETEFYTKGAYNYFELAGMQYTFEPMSERTQE